MSSISDFLGAFKGGTRVNRFRVKSTGGGSVSPIGDHEILIRAAAFPALTVGTTDINFRGKTVKIPSFRTFNPWQILVMDDAASSSGTHAGSLHNKFMQWSDKIVDTGQNLGVARLGYANGGGDNPLNGVKWTVEHLDHAFTSGSPNPAQSDTDISNPIDHQVLKSFTLNSCWPIQVGAIQLDMSVDNQLAFFSVTMAYSHLEDTSSSSGGGGTIISPGGGSR